MFLCEPFREPRPHSNQANQIHTRGLLFAGGDETPKFVWVKIDRQHRSGGSEIVEMPDLAVYFKGGVDRVEVDHNIIQARSMVGCKNEQLVFHCGNMCLFDAPPNLGIRAFTRGAACGTLFRGPWLVMRRYVIDSESSSSISDDEDSLSEVQEGQAEASEESVKCTYEAAWRDMSMRDVRSAADYFTFGERKGDGTVVTGTIVLSPGHQQPAQNGPKFVERNLQIGHYDIIGTRDQASGIANLLGMPVLVRWRNGPSKRNVDYYNPDVARLMIDILSTTTGPHPDDGWENKHIGENGFGSIHESWTHNGVGSKEIVRADGMPMYHTHLQALIAYIHDEVEPRLKKALNGLSPGSFVTEREAVLSTITPTDFFNFWEKFLEDKLRTDKDSDWEDESPPLFGRA